MVDVCRVFVEDPFVKGASVILVVGGGIVIGVACVSMGTVPCVPTICCCCFMMVCCSEDISSATEALLARGWTVTILVPGDFPGRGLARESDVGMFDAVFMPWVLSRGL